MKKYFYIATALVALASCSSNDFVGDTPPIQSQVQETDNAIVFSSSKSAITRGDIYGSAAATLLGSNFYVTGTKGTEATTSPTPTLVFDNYLVHYTANTADETQSNTANWEYVGVTPGVASYASHVKLSDLNTQTIKYWDYSAAQYDFLAFSTGTKAAVNSTEPTDAQIGVTKMKYGTGLASSAVAYTFYIPTVEALRNTFITDIVEVSQANYGKEVSLKFKNLGSKIRIGLYETVPGYSVKNVQFYTVDGTTVLTDANKSVNGTLISANAKGLPTKGKIEVYYPHVGTSNSTAEDYNKAAATVTPVEASSVKYQQFGNLHNFATKERDEADGSYLGRTLPAATFAGDVNAKYYTAVFPVSTSDPLTLRVDYTLVSIDGSAEEITVKGAKAVVPSTYTKWLPNYAYTYIFKISDNTNGWTGASDKPAGLFPITFDAVVTEATDATDEQTTVTTVAAPTITTYQQNHDNSTNEYSKGTGKKVYVQVMNNSTVPATLVASLSVTNSLLYAVSDANATEAEVMNTLENRTTALNADNVTGRNGITLTKDATNINSTVTKIENGIDNNPITITAGQASEINIANLTAGTFAYVYDYTTGDKTAVTEFQPIVVTTGSPIDGTSKEYYTVTKSTLDGTAAVTVNAEAVDAAYIYFSKTTNGGATTIYSYVSVAGKKTLPAGLVKVAKTSITTKVAGTTNAAADTFYFDTYISNDGKYAVKVIKVVA